MTSRGSSERHMRKIIVAVSPKPSHRSIREMVSFIKSIQGFNPGLRYTAKEFLLGNLSYFESKLKLKWEKGWEEVHLGNCEELSNWTSGISDPIHIFPIASVCLVFQPGRVKGLIGMSETQPWALLSQGPFHALTE